MFAKIITYLSLIGVFALWLQRGEALDLSDAPSSGTGRTTTRVDVTVTGINDGELSFVDVNLGKEQVAEIANFVGDCQTFNRSKINNEYGWMKANKGIVYYYGTKYVAYSGADGDWRKAGSSYYSSEKLRCEIIGLKNGGLFTVFLLRGLDRGAYRQAMNKGNIGFSLIYGKHNSVGSNIQRVKAPNSKAGKKVSLSRLVHGVNTTIVSTGSERTNIEVAAEMKMWCESEGEGLVVEKLCKAPAVAVMRNNTIYSEDCVQTSEPLLAEERFVRNLTVIPGISYEFKKIVENCTGEI